MHLLVSSRLVSSRLVAHEFVHGGDEAAQPGLAAHEGEQGRDEPGAQPRPPRPPRRAKKRMLNQHHHTWLFLLYLKRYIRREFRAREGS